MDEQVGGRGRPEPWIGQTPGPDSGEPALDGSRNVLPQRHDQEPAGVRAKALPEEANKARFELHERLRTSGTWIGTRALCEHLERTTVWGEYNTAGNRLRNVQNWLRRLRNLPEGTRGFEYRTRSDNAIEYRRDSRQRLPLASACMALLAERLLEPVLPADYLQSDLETHFADAREQVVRNERTLGNNGDAVSRLIERIAVAPRGQQLVPQDRSRDVAATVTGAILKRRRLDASYGGKNRRLHPYGLILREPKFYLLAVEEAALLADSDAVPRLYLCSRFDDLVASEARNRVPDEFVVADWIASHGLDVPMRGIDTGRKSRFELVLRVHGLAGNLVTDLVDFPLSTGQSIESRPEEDVCVLRAPGMRATEALLEWILGRAERVEVVEPAFLRAAAAERIEMMAGRYC